MTWVATRQDLYVLGGLPASAYMPDAAQLTAIFQPQSTFELDRHGFFGGELVRLAARAGATLPTGISPLAWYTVAPTSDPDFFTLLLSGSPVTLSDAGTGPIFLVEDVAPKIDRLLLARTSYLVSRAKAYRAPWTTPPDWAPQTVAILVADDAVGLFRIASSRYDTENVKRRAIAAEEFCRELNKGVPMEDGVGPVDATPTLAEMGSVIVHLEGRHFHEHDEDRA